MKQISLEKKTGFKDHYNLTFRDNDNPKHSSTTIVSLNEEELNDLYLKVDSELRGA